MLFCEADASIFLKINIEQNSQMIGLFTITIVGKIEAVQRKYV